MLIFSLSWEILTNPKAAFAQIKEKNFIREAIIILASIIFLSVFELFTRKKGELSGLEVVFVSGSIMVMPFVMSAVLHYLAKSAKLPSTFIKLFTLNCLAAVPLVISYILHFLLLPFWESFAFLAQAISIVFSIWNIVLFITGLSIMFSLAMSRAFVLYLKTIFVIFGTVFILGQLSALIGFPSRATNKQPSAGIERKTDSTQVQKNLIPRPVVIDEQELRLKIDETASVAKITVNSIERINNSLKTMGRAEKFSDLNLWLQLLKEKSVKANLASVKKISETELEFVIECRVRLD